MLPHKGLAAYRNTEVQSRTPLELVVMLYDGALKFLAEGRAAIERKDIPARREAFGKALAIISELQSTLNIEGGGPVATSLDELYTYVTGRIIESAAQNAVGPLDEARKVLTPLRDGWHQISTQAPAAIGASR